MVDYKRLIAYHDYIMVHTGYINNYATVVFTSGHSTNFGLKEAIALKWAKLQELESHGDFSTSYGVTYR